ncbi:MAG TPA: hypothetical protein EYP63_07125 [Desulfotomaculum sp.]|nr:hypothetical protein [Desulfotomaculum sp.]
MNLRRFVCIAAMMSLFFFAFTVTASAAPKVFLDGGQLSFDVPPTIEGGRTLVPLRGIFEALGAEVSWDGSTRTVTAVKNGTTVILTIGAKTPYRDGTPIELDVPAKIVSGRTLVPLRFVSESLGAGVEWIGETRTVVITSAEPSAAGMEGTLKWKYETGGYIRHCPAIGSDGTIYAGSEDGCLYALNPDGTLNWRYEVGRSVQTPPAIGSDGTIYFGGAEDLYTHYLYALNPDGTLKWKYKDEEGFSISSGTSVAIGSDGTIYVIPLGNHLYALSPNGTLSWQYEVEGDLPAIYGSPAVGSDGTIYFGASENYWINDEYFYAVNPNGTFKWKHEIGGTVSASPAIGSDGTIYFGAWDHYFYALNPDGTLKWRYDTGGHINASPVIGSDGTIYIAYTYSGLYGTQTRALLALNPDGSFKWRSDGARGVPAIGSDGTIYIPSSGGSFLALNPDGTLKWEYTVIGVVFYTPTIGADGTIYTGGADNYLYAIYGSGSLASTPWPKFQHDTKNTGRVDTGGVFYPTETKSQNEKPQAAVGSGAFTLITDEKDGFIFSSAEYTNDYEKADLFVVPWMPHPHVHERIIDMGKVSPDEVVYTYGEFGEADLQAGHTYLVKGRDSKVYKVYVENIEKNEVDLGGMIQAEYVIALTYEPFS